MRNHRSIAPPFGFKQIRTLRFILALLGLVLITSGTFKLYEFFLVDRQDDIRTLLFYGILPEAEVLAGLWLVKGAHPERSRPWAIAIFSGFWAFSLYRVLTGSCSCGCFGSLTINPWYVLIFDTFAVVVLLKWQSSGEHPAEFFPSLLEIIGIPLTSLVIITAGILHNPLIAIEGTATRQGRPLVETQLTFRGNFVELKIPTDQQGHFRLPPSPAGQYSLSIQGTSAPSGSKPVSVQQSPSKGWVGKTRRQFQVNASKPGFKKSKRPTSALLKQYANIEVVSLDIDECSTSPLAIEF